MKFLLYILLYSNLLYSNNLKNELQFSSSPYLKQHEKNPIHWYPWSKKAFDKARKENKAIFLSIGYSTCHWCHVMAKESFEDEKIAKMFNDYFICIKVDKEEMPHLDNYYQDLYYKVKGRTGGWPLSVFLTQEKKAFYLATYIPKTKKSYHEGLDTLLPTIHYEYKHKHQKIITQAQNIQLVMDKNDTNSQQNISEVSLEEVKKSFDKNYDSIYSGFGRNKKFPEASKLSLMYEIALLDQNTSLQKNVYDMLDTMALRGLYDHIEGGFFRYTVDASWEIPHFEKMLYNQAELIPLYVQAYQRTKKELYKKVVTETIEMLERRFFIDNLYYSASDADSNHIEGIYFTFTQKEIRDALVLNPYATLIEEELEFTIDGNFDQRVHLNFYGNTRPKGFIAFRKKLLKIRESKVYPFIDKKINTAWNAMMIEALYSASYIDKKYAIKAKKHHQKLKAFMFRKGELYHQSLLNKEPQQLGLLEDYSFYIGSLLLAYEVNYDEEDLAFANYLFLRAKNKFYRNGIWYASNDGLNIKANLNDKYYTSALATMLQNILKLSLYKSSFKYDSLAQDTLKSIHNEIKESLINTPASLSAFFMQTQGIVVLKSSQENLSKEKIQRIKYPYVLVQKSDNEMFLACTLRRCFSIDKDLDKVIQSIEQRKW